MLQNFTFKESQKLYCIFLEKIIPAISKTLQFNQKVPRVGLENVQFNVCQGCLE